MIDALNIILLSVIVCTIEVFPTPPSGERFISEARVNVPAFSRFLILLRLRRPHEPLSRPPGRPSPDEVEAGGHGSARNKRHGPPRVDKRAAKRGEHSESQSCDETILDILHISVW